MKQKLKAKVFTNMITFLAHAELARDEWEFLFGGHFFDGFF